MAEQLYDVTFEVYEQGCVVQNGICNARPLTKQEALMMGQAAQGLRPEVLRSLPHHQTVQFNYEPADQSRRNIARLNRIWQSGISRRSER